MEENKRKKRWLMWHWGNSDLASTKKNHYKWYFDTFARNFDCYYCLYMNLYGVIFYIKLLLAWPFCCFTSSCFVYLNFLPCSPRWICISFLVFCAEFCTFWGLYLYMLYCHINRTKLNYWQGCIWIYIGQVLT